MEWNEFISLKNKETDYLKIIQVRDEELKRATEEIHRLGLELKRVSRQGNLERHKMEVRAYLHEILRTAAFVEEGDVLIESTIFIRMLERYLYEV